MIPQSVQYLSAVMDRNSVSADVFELKLKRPERFQFKPGQHVRLQCFGSRREYTVVSSPADPYIGLCIEHIKDGQMTDQLARCQLGTEVILEGPFGYFVFRPSNRHPVFVATGVGVAPFVAMARSGIRDYTLLYGVRHGIDIVFKNLFMDTARSFVACLSGPDQSDNCDKTIFQGRVIKYIEQCLEKNAYDFYLCGNQAMLHDATLLIDSRFPESIIYTEAFF